jgi:site-specific DNA-methyltransferase (adenine-specific)
MNYFFNLKMKSNMSNLDDMVNKIHNIDCVEGMKLLPESCIDLVVTSCPYNVGIQYDTHKDDEPMDQYFNWCRTWLSEIYRTLKDDGRIALNIPYEVNVRERGGRVFIASEFWQIMKEIGFGFFGIVDLEEDSPHRSKTTAWGSWLSPSAPYIYNPKECVILAYKKEYKKIEKGVSSWDYTEELVEVEGKNGEPSTMKNKKIYSQEDKKEFMELVFGQWKYFADTKSLTKATFSLDIPIKAIKILSYKNDLVLDCFSGSGTTAMAAKKLGRNYIGFELSPNYTEISRRRLSTIDYTLFPEKNI